MAKTPSTMVSLGSPAPDFSLPDTVSGETKTLADLKSDKGTLVMFICNHCPFVIHVQSELVNLAKDYMPRGISVVAISSNDVLNYPEDGPDRMKQVAQEYGYPFPYLYDESQDVAKAFAAACTPDFFLYDSELKLSYRGQLDGARPGSDVPVTGEDIRAALDCLIEGKEISPDQKPSIGCNIKWRS